MTEKSILSLLEQACEETVLMDPGDLPALASLHTQIEQIATWASDSGRDQVASAAQNAANLVERIVLNEVQDPAGALEVVGISLGAIQSVLRDGRDFAEAGLEALSERKSTAPEPEVIETPVAMAPLEEERVPLQGDLSLLAEFVTESREHLDAADIHLLTLETDPCNEEALNAVFRAFHTIKGVAGFLALDDIQHLAHEAENLLDLARKGSVELSGPSIDVTFDAVDMLKRLVAFLQEALASGDGMPKEPGLPALMTRLKAAVAAPQNQASAGADVTAEGCLLGEILVDRGAVVPDAIEAAVAAQSEDVQPKKIGELLQEAVLVSRAQVEEALEMQQAMRDQPEPPKLGEILVSVGAVRQRDLDRVLATQATPKAPKLGETLVRGQEAAAKDVAQALRSQQGGAQVKESVKVDADRLDRLVDLIGELVIAESMVSQSTELRSVMSAQAMRHLNQLDKITRELQEMGTGLRMVPVRSTFQKMARLARDVAKKANKQVEFVTVGEDTELDKSVVDKIGDPLVHMVRNAVDHGLEATAAERLLAGKPESGRVELRAFHKGGSIHIEIQDDGRGLDRDAILAKAIERGLVKEGDVLSEREIWNLIFQPGFSTAKTVTDVSGRGVGMDVVKRNIDALRGLIEITSEKGKGSTFSVRLPLTLAIIDGMVVQVGRERYVMPTLSIIRSIRPSREDLTTVIGKGEMLSLQGSLLPLFRLSRLFNCPNAEEDLTQAIVVIAEDDGRQVGLVVDGLLGQQQIVIKSLGDAVQRTPGIAGGAIMPDGHVGLILDIAGLVRLAHAGGADGSMGATVEGGAETCMAIA